MKSNNNGPKIVVIGGGTGSFVVLSSLKILTKNLTAIVSMCDDGGSTGRLRDELGVLPPGDARQCLVALSERPELRDMFSFRFGEGSLAGQSLGNIIISGLELQHGSFEKAIEVAGKILRIRGQVLPVALGSHRLVMQDGDEEVFGEHNIDNRIMRTKNPTVRLHPESSLNPAAAKAISEADLVVIAPGSIYTSLLPIFSVAGMSQALSVAKAPVVMIANLVNKPSQTPNWHVVDYVEAIERTIGGGLIDYVLYNTEIIPQDLLLRYAEDGELSIDASVDRFNRNDISFEGFDLLASKPEKRDKADSMSVPRTLIRHDPAKTAAAIETLLAKTTKSKTKST